MGTASNECSLRDEYHDIIAKEIDIGVELVDEGVGGTYFFTTRTAKEVRKVAVFKPSDEEPCARNNPKGFSDDVDGEKGGIRPGDGWLREVLAYRLDHLNFANVPETLEIKLPNRLFAKADLQKGCKHGSLQRFVRSGDGGRCKASCDVGPRAFPTEDVHRIGQLDVRLLNCDRHGGNALVQRDACGGVRLVPIDHSYILPRDAADLDFEWLFWPQSKQPFSAETKDYIARLDPERDSEILRQFKVDEASIELMHAATLTLQVGSEHGLSLRTIGRFLRRERMYEPSEFESAVAEARRPLEQGGDIDLTRLEAVLRQQLQSRCESPLKRPVQCRPEMVRAGSGLCGAEYAERSCCSEAEAEAEGSHGASSDFTAFTDEEHSDFLD
uniref:PI3K/PI4K catalytic domain-containing protein n=1 Tax=Eutreptiella gymnastica TaxID=73025 RepID=A0A7S4CUS7_9EUGL|mmetsp:Transcript_14478/g.26194  ORF Transcript_14478/g.26194 Transcript_14478/m.26194 type:complete len:385 (-) Transcript_14478:1603-2757(-)